MKPYYMHDQEHVRCCCGNA